MCLREKDYIVVGVQIPHKYMSKLMEFEEVRNIEIPHEINIKIYLFGKFHMYQRQMGLILQTYSDSEAYELQDKWNSMEEHPKGVKNYKSILLLSICKWEMNIFQLCLSL